MSYRPHLAAQLEKLTITTAAQVGRIPKPPKVREIPVALGLGTGMFVATQLVLRHRFGNI